MGFGRAIATCFTEYVGFRGYATRAEYWWWTLFTVLVGLATALLDYALDVNVFNTLAGLALLLPGLAVLIRRLRDAGYAWPWVFIVLVPLVGGIVLLVFVLQRSAPRYPVSASPYAVVQ